MYTMIFKVDGNFVEFPSQNIFDCFFSIKLLRFFEVWEKKHGVSVLSY